MARSADITYKANYTVIQSDFKGVNIVDINALSALQNNLPQGTAARGSSLDFMALIAEACGAIDTPKRPDTDSMTMTEYKSYIYNMISALTFNPSESRDFIAVNISDEGFEAMKNDAEYEKWVLSKIKEDYFSFNMWGNRNSVRYGIKYFGATKEEYRSETWCADLNDIKSEDKYKQKTKDSFWSKRLERMEKIQKMWEELDLKKKFYREHHINIIPTVNANILMELLMLGS